MNTLSGQHSEEPVRDPVCGMSTRADTPHRLSVNGREVRFCSAACRATFAASPSRGLAQSRDAPGAPAAPASARSTPSGVSLVAAGWTCPMHPGVVADRPGDCPACGMALAQVAAHAGPGADREHAGLVRRLWIGLAFGAPVMALDMVAHGPGAHLLQPVWSNWLQMVLATPVVFWAGWPFFRRAVRSVAARRPNMFTLISLGAGMAWAYSVAASVGPDLFPPAMKSEHGTVGVYLEAASMMVIFALLGQILELRARAHAGAALRDLVSLAPSKVHRVTQTGDEEAQLAEVVVGDLLRVRPGERIPVDGIVSEGRSGVDESLVTGESMPVSRASGENVIGGALNQTGALVIEARRVGRDTLLARIVQMVADAQRTQAPVQRMADEVSA